MTDNQPSPFSLSQDLPAWKRFGGGKRPHQFRDSWTCATCGKTAKELAEVPLTNFLCEGQDAG